MRPLIKFTLMILAILPMMVAILPFWMLGLERWRRKVVSLTYAIQARIIGLQVHRVGRSSSDRPLLVVSNHCGYLDIFTLGAAMPISFTPKSDIRWWPLVGWCCTLSGCVYIERKPSRLPQAQKRIQQALKRGRVICLFAEGTTNDGTHLKPFKSGFFSLAEHEPGLMVQPVALRYTHKEGQALDEQGRSHVAWYGDITLLPHLMRLLSWRSIRAEVVYLPPVSMAQFDSRKALAKHCEDAIRGALY